MARIITDAWVRSLDLGHGFKLEETDARSTGLRLRVSGSTVSWQLVMRNPRTGQQLRRKLGTFPAMLTSDARAAADRERTAIRDGTPTEASIRVGLAFDQLADQYLERYAKPRKVSWKNDEIYLRRPRAAWGKAPAGGVSLPDIVDLLDEIAAKAPVSANRTKSVLNTMFNWAKGRRLVAENPLDGFRERPGGAETPKDRVLSDDEIRLLWYALRDRADLGASRPVRDALRTILHTGQRPQEVAGARIEHFNIEGRVWSIPAALMKSRRPHSVPLNDAALDLLVEVIGPRTSGPVFASPRDRTKSIARNSLSQSVPSILAKVEGIAPFTPHDLRRTAATIARRAGAAVSDVGALLGHVEPSLTAKVYAISDRMQEKQRAVDWLQVALEAVIPENFGAMR